MDEEARQRTPSAEELERADIQLREFLAKIKAVPEVDRKLQESDKFAGPIATKVIDPEADAQSE